MSPASAAKLARLRAELRTRDLFLSKLAGTLYSRASALERAARSSSTKLPSPVQHAITELHALLRELHVVAEPSAPVQLRRRKRELCGLLASFFADRELLFAKNRLELTIQRTGAILCNVDAAHFASMLDELLSNALKYRRTGPVTLSMKLTRRAVCISVENHSSWVGPRPKYRRFQRGEARRSVPGFGVGLWLTRRLVEAHGGSFRIRAKRAHSCAVITLPFAAVGGGPAQFRATLVRRAPVSSARIDGDRQRRAPA